MNGNEASKTIESYLNDLSPAHGIGFESKATTHQEALRISDDLFAILEQNGFDPANLKSERQPLGRGVVDEALARLERGKSLPSASLRTFSDVELVDLVKLGRITRLNIFDEDFAEQIPTEVDRLIDGGVILPAKDRVTDDGTPLEWITSQGPVWNLKGRKSALFSSSNLLGSLFDSMVAFAESYNATLERAGTKQGAEFVAPEGTELNINCVIGGAAAQWSGLHPHQDMNRFTDGLRALPDVSVRHAAIRARALTLSVYFRRDSTSVAPGSQSGGFLTFYVPQDARGPNDRAIFDVVPADHNTGAVFLPGTVHGVARMPPAQSVRYSAQAFFPGKDAWNSKIKPRIESGELARELDEVGGSAGWR